ncbi:MAG: hypothetical protein EA357_10640 [Micavibrio sp.]|nr:MAG: hypothetical protein EA357_10640 [Micavibrio sp.]
MTDKIQEKRGTQALRVAARAHPFAAAGEICGIAEGLTLAEIAAQIQPDPVLRRFLHIFTGEDCVPREKWHLIRPKAGAMLYITAVPAGGGGGKNPLRTVLSLAVLASTSFLGTALSATAFGQASFLGISGGRLMTGALSFAGRLAMNALAPPPRPRAQAGVKTAPTLFIQGAQNRLEPFGKVPQPLGKIRMVPPMGAHPFTETFGDDQYLRLLFVWGYGPLEIGDLKIGETPLQEFKEVEIEHCFGAEGEAPPALYGNTVIQTDLQAVLRQEGGYHIRTTESDADEISVDMTFPRGLAHFGGNGARHPRSVKVEVQFAPAGTEEWSAGAEEFKQITAQETESFTPPETENIAPEHPAYPARFCKRIDRIVINRATGVLRVLTGEKRGGYTAEGAVTEFTQGEALPPAVPETHLKIAAVTHLGDQILTEILDERNPEFFENIFEYAEDFAATIDGDKIVLAGGGLKFFGLEVTAAQSNALRRSLRFAVEKGQYDVRMRRLTPDSEDDAVFDETVWTALHILRYEIPVQMQGLAMTALRIRATDQLSGVIDRFNGVVRTVLPDWNGEDWVKRVTSNPAALFRHVLQGAANARPLPDSRIDFEKLQDWHAACAAAGREFNAVIDYQASVRDVLLDIAAAGRASPSVIDGKWGVVRDIPQSVPVQHFTPRNSRDFQGEKQFDTPPHALRIRFANREKLWQQDELIVYDDGYNAETATRFETLDLPGITDPAQIWRDGRYHIATARLRPEKYSFTTDIEHIVCTRGDLIRLTHDVPLFGLHSARVKEVVQQDGLAVAVTLDAEVEIEAGKDYSLRFRKADGSSLVAAVTAQGGAVKTLQLQTPLAEQDAPQSGDLAMFGETGRESAEMIVQAIRPGSDFSARIICVDAAPEIHQADQGEIPVFDAQISIPPELRRPPRPQIISVQSGPEVLLAEEGGFAPRILVYFAPPPAEEELELRVDIRAVEEAFFQKAAFTKVAPHAVSITGVKTGGIYDLRFFYIRRRGWASQETLLPNYFVTGTGGPPRDVENFRLNIHAHSAYLSWDASSAPNLSHYVLRFAPGSAAAGWEEAVDMMPAIGKGTNSVSVPALAGTYLIKAVDLDGRMSENPAKILSGAAGLAGYNAVAVLDEAPDFAGAKNAMAAIGGALRLAGQDSIDGWAAIDTVQRFDIGLSGLAESGTYGFGGVFDLGAVYSSTLSAEMEIAVLDLSNTVDEWVNIDLRPKWDSAAAGGSVWDVRLQLRITEDDPQEADAEWSEWTDFLIGDYTARGFDFRLVAESADAFVTPVISALRVKIDMPDRVDGAEDILSDASGSAVGFGKIFRNIPAVAVAGHDMQTGDYFAVENVTAAGFNIRFFNAAGEGIVRRFDYVAKGYGIQQ